MLACVESPDDRRRYPRTLANETVEVTFRTAILWRLIRSWDCPATLLDISRTGALLSFRDSINGVSIAPISSEMLVLRTMTGRGERLAIPATIARYDQQPSDTQPSAVDLTVGVRFEMSVADPDTRRLFFYWKRELGLETQSLALLHNRDEIAAR